MFIQRFAVLACLVLLLLCGTMATVSTDVACKFAARNKTSGRELKFDLTKLGLANYTVFGYWYYSHSNRSMPLPAGWDTWAVNLCDKQQHYNGIHCSRRGYITRFDAHTCTGTWGQLKIQPEWMESEGNVRVRYANAVSNITLNLHCDPKVRGIKKRDATRYYNYGMDVQLYADTDAACPLA